MSFCGKILNALVGCRSKRHSSAVTPQHSVMQLSTPSGATQVPASHSFAVLEEPDLIPNPAHQLFESNRIKLAPLSDAPRHVPNSPTPVKTQSKYFSTPPSKAASSTDSPPKMETSAENKDCEDAPRTNRRVYDSPFAIHIAEEEKKDEQDLVPKAAFELESPSLAPSLSIETSHLNQSASSCSSSFRRFLVGTLTLSGTAITAYFFVDTLQNDSHGTANTTNSNFLTGANYIDPGTVILGVLLGMFSKTALNLFLPRIANPIKKYEHIIVPIVYAVPAILPQSLPASKVNLYTFSAHGIRAGSIALNSLNTDSIKNYYSLLKSKLPNVTWSFSGAVSAFRALKESNHTAQSDTLSLDILTRIKLLMNSKNHCKEWTIATSLGVLSLSFDLTLANGIEDEITKNITKSLLKSIWCMSSGYIGGQIFGLHKLHQNNQTVNALIYYLFPSLVNPDQDTNLSTADGRASYAFHALLLMAAGFCLGQQATHMKKTELIERAISWEQIDTLKKMAHANKSFFVHLQHELMEYHAKTPVPANNMKAFTVTKWGLQSIAAIVGIAAPLTSPLKNAANLMIASLNYTVSYHLAKKYRPSPFHYSTENNINYFLSTNLLPVLAMWGITANLSFTSEKIIELDKTILYVVNAISSGLWALVTGSFASQIIEGKLRNCIDLLDSELKDVVTKRLSGNYRKITIAKDRFLHLKELISQEENAAPVIHSNPIKLTLTEAIFILASIKDLIVDEADQKISLPTSAVLNNNDSPLETIFECPHEIEFIEEEVTDNTLSVIEQAVISMMLVSKVARQVPLTTDLRLGL